MAGIYSMETGGDIVNLNVGGTRFSTSKQTLTWVPDSFFSSMLSARISTHKDDRGAIFIDRDPELFARILNYLRTKEVDLSNVNLRALKHEAEFYSITPLVRRLVLCEQLEESACGDILFHGTIPPPHPPLPVLDAEAKPLAPVEDGRSPHSGAPTPDRQRLERQSSPEVWGLTYRQPTGSEASSCSHSRHSSIDLRRSSLDLRTSRHLLNLQPVNPLRVNILKGHFNWIAAAYPHFVCLYRLKDSTGWQLFWTSPYIEQQVHRIALNAKVVNPSQENTNRMVAASFGTQIHLWSVNNDGNTREIGTFNMTVYPEHLFFIGSQLVALSPVGKVGVWHAMTQNWQIQDVSRITSYDTAGSFLLLGCENGTIHNIDMQKFPLRMKDNDLLVTELYRDPAGEAVTALSVYLTPKTSLSGNWIEIAYGTNMGTVRVIVQHPETVGQGPQLFQTFTVHRSPITKVMLSEKHLISVCSEYNHVRSWSVTRFRSMISTQPGSMPLASFKVVSLDDVDPQLHHTAGNDIGPFGEKDEQQVFVQKVVTETVQLFVRLASTGKRVCLIKSVDGTNITAFCVHECEGSTRMGSRPRRYIFTGHTNGSIQMWDLSTALDLSAKNEEAKVPDKFGPSPQEIMEQLDLCELSNSCSTTPSVSPSPSLLASSQHTPQTLRRRLVAEQLARNMENHGLGATPSDLGAGTHGPEPPRTEKLEKVPTQDRVLEQGPSRMPPTPSPKVTKF